jgi:RHS repeat-associated protein
MKRQTARLIPLALLVLPGLIFANNPFYSECQKECASCGAAAETGDSTKCEPFSDASGVSISVTSDVSQEDADRKCAEALKNTIATTTNASNPNAHGVTPLNYKRAALIHDGGSPDSLRYETVNGTRTPRQLASPRAVFDITDTADGKGYQINQYWKDQLPAPGTNGIRTVPAGLTPVTSTIFRNPDGAATTTSGKLDVLHRTIHPTTGTTVTRAVRFNCPVGQNSWSRSYYLGDPAEASVTPYRVISMARVINIDGTETITETTQDRATDGTTLVTTAKTKTKYAFYKFGFPVPLFQTVYTSSSDPTGLTTTWTYNTNHADRTSFNKPATMRGPGGEWADYTYQGSDITGTLMTKTVTGWLDNAAPAAADPAVEAENRVVTVIEARNDTGTFGREEKIQGITVARTWGERHKNNAGEVVETTHTQQGATTLTTIRTGYPDNASATAAERGRLKSIQFPDGTVELHRYQTQSENRVETTESGSGTPAGVTAGTRTISTWSNRDVLTKQVVEDVASGINLSTRQAIAFTSAGSPTRWAYDNNPEDFSETLYGCCGIDSTRGRDGTTTSYTHDALKRPTTAVSNGITTTYIYGQTADGFPSVRITRNAGTGASARSLDEGTSVSDLAGRLIRAISPDLNGDTTDETTSTSYDSAVQTTTNNPDGGAVVSTSFIDGQAKAISGTAAPDASYQYTVGTDIDGIAGAVMKATVTRPSGSDIGDLVTDTYTGVGGQTLASRTNGVVTATYGYDSSGRLVLATDGDSVKTQHAYNGLGERYRTAVSRDGNATIDPGTDTVTDTVREVADVPGFGPAVRTTQKVWTGANTAVNVSISLRSPDGLSISTDVIGQGTTTSSSASFLERTDGEWSDTITNPDGTRTITTYNAWLPITVGHFTSGQTLTPVSSVTTGYDSLRRPESASDSRTATAVTRKTIYHATNGLVTAVTEDLVNNTVTADRTTSFLYNSMGRRAVSTFPDGSKSYATYTHSGQSEATWGSQTYPTFATYDEQGRLKELRTYRNLTTAQIEAANLDLGAVNDYSSTKWIYYPNGRLEKKLDAANKGPVYTYTTAGRIQTRTWERPISSEDPTKVRTTYGFINGLLDTVSYNDGTPGLTYFHDVLGRVWKISQASQSEIEFTFADDLGTDTETIRYDTNRDGDFNDAGDLTRVLDRAPRSLGRDKGWDLKKPLATPPGGYQTQISSIYDYDAATGRLATVAGASAGTFTYSYVAGGDLPESVTRSPEDGQATLKAVRTYDATRDSLASIENRVNALAVSTYDYSTVNGGVNNLGQRNGVQATFNISGLASNTGATSWDYDLLGQVTKADAPATGTNTDRSYSFDTIGNRKEAATGTWSLDDDNQPVFTPAIASSYFGDSAATELGATPLNQYAAIAITGGATVQPHHDDDGSMTTGPLPIGPTTGYTLVWDAENRLVEVRNGVTSLVKYTYDAFSRRIGTTVGTGANAITTLFLYDGWNCLAEYDGATLDILRTYLWGLDLSGTFQGAGGVGGMLAMHIHAGVSAGFHYPTFDGNGNVSEYITSAGSVSAHFEYDPFGNTVVNSDLTAKAFAYRFSTKPLDFITGLYYYGYRWLDPLTGRWSSRDPIDENWSTGEFNEYAYIRNFSVYFYDVLGLFGGGGWATPRPSQVNEPGDRNPKTGETWFNGHGDFANLEECPFDFEKEDDDPLSSPVLSPANHFQPLDPGEDGSTNDATRPQIESAIKNCDADAFQRAMHRGQDYFSHFRKGYRWDPTRVGDMKLWFPKDNRWGHLWEILDSSLPNPDHDNSAWDLANIFTFKELGKWNDACCRECCNGCKWVRRGSNRCGNCPAPKIQKMGRKITEARKLAEQAAAAVTRRPMTPIQVR